MPDELFEGLFEVIFEGFKKSFIFIGKMLRSFFVDILFEVVFYYLFNWVGYHILRPFKKDIEMDSAAATLAGIIFWIVPIIFLVLLFVP